MAMTIKEIKDKICDLRFEVENLADECNNLWRETDDDNISEIADYLNNELTEVAYKLSDLEDTEQEDYEQVETYEKEDADTICDWWSNLDLAVKCELSKVPMPTSEYGRGDDYYYCEERCNKWWQSRTLEQKREIYNENPDWWD